MNLSNDFVDLLSAFAAERVSYLLIGGYAVAFHGHPRFTKDIDLWLGPGEENIQRCARALISFGAPPDIVETIRSLGSNEIVFFGVPPNRVDILRDVAGLSFADADARRVDVTWEGVPVRVLSLQDLLAAKRAAGRPQDLQDTRLLEAMDKTRRPRR